MFAVASALELQFSQAVSAAEMAGALSRQGAGTFTNFQNVAEELLAVHQDIASIELQPGGVVSSVLPSRGNEQAIGFDVFRDPVRRPHADTAVQRRTLAVAGPVRLHGGEIGIAAMVPVFTRGGDNRESFWGFVTVSMRLTQALSSARLNELSTKGYDYALLAPVPALRKTLNLAGSGRVSRARAVRQRIRARNLEWTLAMEPRAGWVDKRKLILDGLGVCFVTGLLALSVSLWNKRRESEASSAAMHDQLASEIAERKQAQEQSRSATERAVAAEAELNQLRSALVQSEQNVTQLEARLNETERDALEKSEAATVSLKQFEARTRELELQLEARIRAAHETTQAHKHEVDTIRGAVKAAAEKVTELQAKLEEKNRAEQAAIAGARSRAQQDQSTISDLQRRLEESTRSEEAAVVRFKQLKEDHQVVTERLILAEHAEAKLVELRARLEATEAELRRWKDVVDAAAQPPQTEDGADLESESPESDGSSGAVMDENPAAIPADESAKAALQPHALPVDPTATATPDPLPESPRVEPPAEPHEPRSTQPKEPDRPPQLDLFGEQGSPGSKPKEHRKAAIRSSPVPPPVNLPELRKVVNQILPLLTDQDPGAQDCVKANRATFRSAFSADGYVEFEKLVLADNFRAALECLKRAAGKHGV